MNKLKLVVVSFIGFFIGIAAVLLILISKVFLLQVFQHLIG